MAVLCGKVMTAPPAILKNLSMNLPALRPYIKLQKNWTGYNMPNNYFIKINKAVPYIACMP